MTDVKDEWNRILLKLLGLNSLVVFHKFQCWIPVGVCTQAFYSDAALNVELRLRYIVIWFLLQRRQNMHDRPL